MLLPNADRAGIMKLQARK